MMDNEYTKNYLIDINNKKESIFDYIPVDNKDTFIEELFTKYEIEPTNWASFFTPSCWEKDEQSGEYYMHIFSQKQDTDPALS